MAGWVAVCDGAGHAPWMGKERDKESDAKNDAGAHDKAKHEGQKTASVQYVP
jgi:hypothetical protein